MTKNNDLVFHTRPNDSQRVLYIECNKPLEKDIKLAASKLKDSRIPNPEQYGLTISFLKSILEVNNSAIYIKSNQGKRASSFEEALPLFADYFATLNTQTEKTNKEYLVFHTDPSKNNNVTNVECEASFMDEIRNKASILKGAPSQELIQLTCQSLKSSIEQNKRAIYNKSGNNLEEISFEDSLPLFADYFATLNSQSNCKKIGHIKYDVKPGAIAPENLKNTSRILQ